MVSKQKNADSNVFRVGLLSLVGVAAGLLPLQLRAASACYWNDLAGDGLWTNPGNWTGRVPQDGDTVYFRCGGSLRVSLEGVTNALAVVQVGYENDETQPKTDVTLVGGKLTTSSICKIFPGNAIYLENGEFVANASALNVSENAGIGVFNGRFEINKLNVGAGGFLTIDHAVVLGRLSLSENVTFRVTSGSEYKTRGDEISAKGTTIFDVTGGRYIIGRETTTKGWSSAISFANDYKIADKLDEYVVEYPTGGEMTLRKSGLAAKSNIGWTNETVFALSGGTTEAPVTNQLLRTLPASPGMAREFGIAKDAVAFLNKDNQAHLQFIARHVSIEDGATVVLANRDRFIASYGSSVVSPTAKVRLEVMGTQLSAGKTYPVLLGAPDAADLSALQFSFVPALDVGSVWRVACVGPYAYLTDDAVVDATTANYWTGKGSDSNYSTEGNWATSAKGGANPYFAGAKRTVINVDEDFTGKALRFTSSCAAPFILDSNNGKAIKINRSQPNFGLTSSSIYSASRYPVVLKLPVTTSAGDVVDTIFTAAADGGIKATDGSTSLDSAGPGYVAFMDALTLGNRTFKYRGDIMIGGTATAGTLDINTSESRGTMLHVLNGGSLTVSKQANDIAVTSSFAVEGGGTLSFAAGDGAFTYSMIENQHIVDGLLDIQVPFSGSVDIGFAGTGVVQVARIVAPDAGSSVVKLSGGVTFKPAAWETDQITLAVPSGEEGVLEVAANATGDHGNLIAVGRDATLVKTGAGALRFSMPATIDGTLDVHSGSVELAGALKTAADSGYVDVLTAADISGTIQVPEKYGFRIIKNADGNKVLCMREKKGLMLIFR